MIIDLTKKYAILEDKERMEPIVEIDFETGRMTSLFRGHLCNYHNLNDLEGLELVEITEDEYERLRGRGDGQL